MKFAQSFAIASYLTTTALPSNSWAQTLVDPSRLSQGVRPDVTAQPLLRDESAQVALGFTEQNPFAPASPGDQDLGPQVILKQADLYKALSVSLDSSEYFTSNAADVSKGAQQDWFYVGGLTLGYQPRLSGRLYGDFSVAQHWFRYGRISALDYEDGEAAAGLILVMPELWNTLWHLHYYYERITQGIDNTPTYQTHVLRAGMQKNLLLDRLNSFDLSLLASVPVDTSPSFLSRGEYSALVGWNYKIMRPLTFTLSYRIVYYDYLNFEGRKDWYHDFGVALAYHPREWLDVTASWIYTLNRSNRDTFSYDSQIAGPAVALRMKF